jgi:hypothetical protein
MTVVSLMSRDACRLQFSERRQNFRMVFRLCACQSKLCEHVQPIDQRVNRATQPTP